MARRLLVLLAVLASLVTVAPTALAQSAPACQYILGFATLHGLDSADTGGCLDNQAFAANGDAQQHTTAGLLAWRKADNWTAFTNGYWTWINGPYGLVKRLNTDRFRWEHDVVPSVTSAAPSTSTTPASPLPPPVAASAPQPPTTGTDTASPPPPILPSVPVNTAPAPVAPAPQPTTAPQVAPPANPYPSDITAVCNDGTYSYSAHASGTCSHHGGVGTWVNHP